MRSPPSRTRRAATLVAAFVVALLAMEGGLRVYYYAPTVEDPVEGTLDSAPFIYFQF